MEPTINNEALNITHPESFFSKHAALVTVSCCFLHVSLFIYVVKYRGVLSGYSNPFDAILPFFLLELSVPFIIFLLGINNFYGKKKEIFRGLLWSLSFILIPVVWLLLVFVVFAMGIGGGH